VGLKHTLSARSFPILISSSYALQLWASPPRVHEFIKYGVLGEPIIAQNSKKRGIDIHDLIRPNPPLLSKIQMQMPPSIQHIDDNSIRECNHSAIQLRFLFHLYLLNKMKVPTVKSEGLALVIDHDFFDITREHRVIYKCPDTDVAAVEVHLQRSAAIELTRLTVISPRDEVITRIQDVDNAEDFVEKMCNQDNSLKAVLIGPFPVRDFQRLQEEVSGYQKHKEALDVQPDLAFAKILMYTGFATIAGASSQHELGKSYAYVVYVPSTSLGENRITMTIGELEAMAKHDETVDDMTDIDPIVLKERETIDIIASSILRSFLKPIAVMQLTCGEYSCWKVRDNYINFEIEAQESGIVVKSTGFRVITETLLGTFPDFRQIGQVDQATTAEELASIILEQNAEEAEALDLLARLMIEGKPVVVHTEEPEIVVNDDLIAEAIGVFKSFVNDVGNNGNGKGWDVKADKVKELEQYIRQKLAVDEKSFCFLEEMKLSNHQVKWMINGQMKNIKWVKLLKAYGRGRRDSLGAIPKDRQYFKELLNTIVDKFGQW